ncbi:FERM, ARHGEF and pleckstrin domain-containing protein 2 isoform X3 [Plutella xylostella]|uniref:FERM, ARHGEF and pleckstrin domain-containing protein 2 isoform X3 n=1 Tax=Plutella xylostella TaxID=51655 RepID=UPI002032A23A|nr:FERM, ARHGEF and pleckstrin domain-containing protein 2 isoform X3 [Plutella xylostella]
MMDSELPPGSCNSTGHLSTIGYHTAPGRMHHSASTPAGVDGAGGGARTPPATPKKGGKMLALRVQMLDDTISMFQIQSKALGKVLFEQVCKQLHLLEADYFGLEYQDVNGTKYWLDIEKPICRQVGLSMLEPTLRFCVKFYTPDPARLEEEFTRYLFCLQVKRDLAHATIQCNENTAALMASYIIQAECGDFVPEDYPDHSYLSGYKFFPGQDAESERRIMENHKKHIGQSPAEADLNLLETARRCELYGIKMHPAKDHENVPLNLAVAHMGIVVFQHTTKINTFSWAKIRKISFKRKKFLIKLHPEGYSYYRDVVEFFFDGRNECKNFWKKCVENHGFFRCSSVPRPRRHKPRVITRGSSFRYSGRTQKQIVEYVRDNYVKRQTFQRSASFRGSRSLRSSRGDVAAPVNASVSAHPLLPLPPGSDAISLEWAAQPHYVEAAWMMRGYSRAEAREAAARPIAARSQANQAACTMLRERQPGPEVVTHAEVNHHRMEDSPPPHRMMTPLTSPESIWKVASTTCVADSGRARTPPPRAPPPAPRPDGDSTSPDEDVTVSSASLLLSPRTDRAAPPLCASTPMHGRGNDNCDGKLNGNVDNSIVNHSAVNNGNGPVVSESTHSIDVLSGGESDTGDTLSRSRLNNNSISSGFIATVDRKKRGGGDLAYCIAKQLLMTERTYKRDLQLVTVTWSISVSGLATCQPSLVEALGRPCLALEPLALAQGAFLAALEQAHRAHINRENEDSEPEYKRIAELLYEYLSKSADAYTSYTHRAGALLARLESARRGECAAAAGAVCAAFDCAAPLPLACLLLRPLHALLLYTRRAAELSQIADNKLSCQLHELTARLAEDARGQLRHAENHAALCQLQRDILGYDKLLVADREFLKLGCVFKHSTKGLQQRMLFLFSDMVLMASKASGGAQFRAHLVLPLHSLTMRQEETNCLTLIDGETSLTISAGNASELESWRESIARAVELAPDTPVDTELTPYEQDVVLASSSSTSSMCAASGGALLHVCWHRVTSLTRDHLHLAMKTQLSGYLLRKFKNSHGWQKLWVVYAVFSLYFYKSWQDDAPLASLPLLGYTVGAPSEKDGVHKEFVFKLQYKNHVYFFRADTAYTYAMWTEALQTAMVHSQSKV